MDARFKKYKRQSVSWKRSNGIKKQESPSKKERNNKQRWPRIVNITLQGEGGRVASD